MGQLHYRANKINEVWLKDNKFLYSRAFSDPDDPVYIKNFAVYKWNDVTTLEAEIRLHIKTLEATVDVYDGCSWSRSIYAPFYCDPNPAYKDYMKQIMANIERECERLDFVRISD